MLNPKLIELYGSESTSMIINLIKEIGEDLSSACYVVPSESLSIGSSKVPYIMRTNNPNMRDEIVHRIFNFIDRYTNPEDEKVIHVLYGELPQEGDIQLWLCSN